MYITSATGRNHLGVLVVSWIRSDDPESLILVTLAESATDGAVEKSITYINRWIEFILTSLCMAFIFRMYKKLKRC